MKEIKLVKKGIKALEKEKEELRALELLANGIIVKPSCLTDKVYLAMQAA